MHAKSVGFLVILSVAGLSGCKSAQTAQSVPGNASLGMMRSQPAVVSLGAGDSLGRRVYLNDLVIAARFIPMDVAVTSVGEGEFAGWGE